MKVLNIEKTPTTDGFLWLVQLAKKDGTPSKVPLRETTEPSYKVGDEIYSSNVELIKPEQGDWYYKRKEGATQVSRDTKPKGTWRMGKNDDEWFVQWMTTIRNYRQRATELECHHIIPGGEKELENSAKRIDNIVSQWVAADAVMIPKKGEETTKTND